MSDVAVIRSRLERPASLGRVGGFRPPDDPVASWLGRVGVIGSEERWPTSGGTSMAGVAQINLLELPYVPPALVDTALITLFMDVSEGRPSPPSDAANGDGWLLRAYADLSELRQVDGVTAPAIKPFPLRWERTDADVPAWEDAAWALSADELEAVADDYDELVGRPADGVKVGGWPTLLQGQISWAPWNDHPARPEFVLQIDSDAKTGISWGDAGVVHIGRGTRDRDVWALEWQCV